MSVFFRLCSYLRPYRLFFSLALTLVAAISAMELLKPWPIKLAVDQVIGKQPLEIWGLHLSFGDWPVESQVMGVIGLLLFTHLGTGFVQLLNNYITIRMGQDMVQDFRCELFDHLQSQSLLFHQKRPTGDIIYRLMGDTYAVQSLFMNGVFSSLTSVVLLVGMFFILLGLDVELTLYSLAVVPILLLFISKVSKRIGSLSMESYNRESLLYSTVEQIFSSISLVQAFAREEDERHRFVAQSKSSFDSKLSLYSLQTVYGWLVNGLTAAGTGLVLYIGVQHVLDGALSTGELLVFLSYLASLYTPINNLSTTVANIRAAMSQAKRVLDILDADESVQEIPDAQDLVVKKGEVRYEDVSFEYEPGQPILEDVSFACPGGSMIALVGQTGAGKTSMISLLLRFFDPTQGRILVDGQDLRQVSLKSLRETISVVLQDTQLFPMTVKENIAYGRKSATLEEVVAAAKLANAHEFIVKLPEAYNTILGEKGANLSGGQRQRLSIARAILKNAPILVLDEPTSALDAETEALIMEGLERLIKGRTTFVIAHRLSMMKRAHTILVVKDHHVVESGTFEQLMAKGGEFARLHAIQQTGKADATPETEGSPA